MPLDGHRHLVKQGWSGKGTGLRNGAIAKPITVTQKKTLAGIGKDRDEAFPFWDHVFQAAAVSIQVKVHDSDDESGSESDSESSGTPALELKRTATGIISNRRPLAGTPALSGATTPTDSQASSSSSGSATPRLSLMAAAKQQAARRMLYAMFYRGPVLATDEDEGVDEEPSPLQPQAGPSRSAISGAPKTEDEAKAKESGKSRKRKAETEEEKRERKRRKREAKEKADDEERKPPKSKQKGKGKEENEVSDRPGDNDGLDKEDSESRAARKAAKAERKQRRAEKRAQKEERRARRAERNASFLKEQSAANQTDKASETIPLLDEGAADTRKTAKKPKKAKREREEVTGAEVVSSDTKSKKKARKP